MPQGETWIYPIIYNWVKKEPHEMVNLSPAVKKIRSGREATNGAFKSELFSASLQQLTI